MAANVHFSPLFQGALNRPSVCRIDDFISWAKPGGTAGINNVHAPGFNESAPYFVWHSRLLHHSDVNARSWFLKFEFLRRGREVFAREKRAISPSIFKREGLFEEGQYLAFSKAYVNIISHYRDLRSIPKPLIQALSYLECSLRRLNQGDNDPSKLNSKSFEIAGRLVEEDDFSASRKYDIGKELEILAGMLQSGYSSKSFAFEGKGFRLLDRAFAFSSGIPQAPRIKAIPQTDEVTTQPKRSRISNETVAAVGLAYRKAVSTFGTDSAVTFMASIAGFAFTAASVRISELLSLRRDAIYLSGLEEERYRLRIFRPKINTYQDIPLSKRLGHLSFELISCILDFSKEAHQALLYYESRFGESFKAIDDLFIPDRLKNFFEKPFLTLEEVKTVLGSGGDSHHKYVLKSLEMLRFVAQEGDLYPSVDTRTIRVVKACAIEEEFFRHGIESHFPSTFPRQQYVSKECASRHVNASAPGASTLLEKIFSNGEKWNHYVRSGDLKRYLLAEFKRTDFPHWPFISKDHSVRVSEALLVWFERSSNAQIDPLEKIGKWWCPRPVSAMSITCWLGGVGCTPPILFSSLGIRLKDGEFASLSIHQTRKYHQTESLLAGASVPFIDELAGRSTGRQSDHYDLRTPDEIVRQSIETFDPDEDFEVIGPVADEAKSISIVDRKTFLFENAAPKHITEVGGCITDWSLDPCEHFGECLGCVNQVWRKGDKIRLEAIRDQRQHALQVIPVAERKLAYGDESHSLAQQLRQFKRQLARCELILSVENDHEIAIGTIVTFSPSEDAYGLTDMTFKLREENLRNDF